MNDIPNQLDIKKPDTGDPRVDEYLRHVLGKLDGLFKRLAEDRVTASKGIKIGDWTISQADAADVTAGDANTVGDLMVTHKTTGPEWLFESTA